MVPNIYHLFYTDINNNFNICNYFCIKSIIEINKSEKIYFNYIILPTCTLWDKIKDKLILKRIFMPYEDKKKDLEVVRNILIYKSLLDLGGIYIDLNSICINPISEIKDDFIKSKNNEIICSEKNSPIANKYFEHYVNNEHYFIDNSLYNLNYDSSYENIMFNEIHDYSFGPYFHLVENCKFIHLPENNLFTDDVYNKITIYSLLVRNILGYNLINNNNNLSLEKCKLINNIDTIYWINLESSEDRRNNMIKILDNFPNIKSERISAIDGSCIQDINISYFYSENNIYPKYSNKEYAILLSHLNTIYKYANTDSTSNKYGVALILEDDLSLDFMNYWEKDIATIIKEVPEDWDIIMLGYFSLNLNRKETYQKWNNEWSAIAYLVNHKNIQKIGNLKMNEKWICNEYDLMVSDNYIFSKFNTYVYNRPYFTFPNNNDSTFHSDHLQYHKIYKICNYITLNNLTTI